MSQKKEEARVLATFEAAASELGFPVVEQPGGHKTATGVVDGCDATVTFSPPTKSGNSSWPTRITLHVAPPSITPPPPAFSVAKRKGPQLPRGSFVSADPEWSKRFVVKATDTDAVNRYLITERRQVFDAILASFPDFRYLSETGGPTTKGGQASGPFVERGLLGRLRDKLSDKLGNPTGFPDPEYRTVLVWVDDGLRTNRYGVAGIANWVHVFARFVKAIASGDSIERG